MGIYDNHLGIHVNEWGISLTGQSRHFRYGLQEWRLTIRPSSEVSSIDMHQHGKNFDLILTDEHLDELYETLKIWKEGDEE